MLRRLFLCYLAISAGLIVTSAYTGHRAKVISGKDYYLFTRTRIFVDREIEPQDEADAEFQLAMREAGEDTTIAVDEPCFVLGFLDATAPFILLGGISLLAAKGLSRRWRRARTAGEPRPVG